MSIQGLDIEIVEEYNTHVHINNKLDWTHNTDVLYKKSQSCLHLLRRMRSFGVRRTLLKTFYDSVVISDLLRCGLLGLWKLREGQEETQQAGEKGQLSLGLSLDSIEEVGDRRMLTKLTSIMDNPSHPLHETVCHSVALTAGLCVVLPHVSPASLSPPFSPSPALPRCVAGGVATAEWRTHYSTSHHLPTT